MRDRAFDHLIGHCIEAGESALAARLVLETSFGQQKLARIDTDYLPMLGSQLTNIFDDVPQDMQAEYQKQFELITEALPGGSFVVSQAEPAYLAPLNSVSSRVDTRICILPGFGVYRYLKLACAYEHVCGRIAY